MYICVYIYIYVHTYNAHTYCVYKLLRIPFPARLADKEGPHRGQDKTTSFTLLAPLAVGQGMDYRLVPLSEWIHKYR